MVPVLTLTYNASGAAWAAGQGLCVVIVDVINMSTTAEALLDEGIIQLWGAAPSHTRVPVPTDPEHIGFLAGKAASQKNTEVFIITEPRVGTEEQRIRTASAVLSGLRRAGHECSGIFPNLGAETVKFTNFKDKMAVLVTDTGGAAFDAALYAGAAAVLTGTNARTMKRKGISPCTEAALRAINKAKELNTGIAVVAASASSWEDILAAGQIGSEIIKQGFLVI